MKALDGLAFRCNAFVKFYGKCEFNCVPHLRIVRAVGE